MKILSLYVDNFGGLSSFSMNFDDGMTVLHQPNGWGKSSLAVFIKAMLYGLPASTKRSLIENERKRYTPWQGGVFGGSMDVLLGEKRLRIERRFGEKESMDTLILTDLDTGLPMALPQRLTLGEEWFGVDAAAYERSTYLSERPTDESDGNLSIHAKLNRLIDATDDIGSFDAAMELLERQRKYYSLNSGRRGAIADEEARLMALEADCARCAEQAIEAQSSAHALQRLQSELRENQAMAAQLAEKERAYHEQREQRAKASHLAQLQELLARETRNLEELLNGVGGKLPDDEQLQRLEQVESEITAATLLLQQKDASLSPGCTEMQQADTLRRYFGEHIPTKQEIDALRTAASELQNAAQRWRDHQSETSERNQTMPQTSETQATLDWAKYRRFCMQYPAERAKYEQPRNQAAEKICKAESLRKASLRKGKCCAWVAGVCGALGVAAALIMLAIYPSLLWLPLAVGLAGALGGLIGRARMTTAAEKEQKTLAEAQQTLQQAQEKYDMLVRQWKSVCQRLEQISGEEILDAAQALEIISAQEAAAQRAAVEKQEQERIRAAREQRERSLSQALAQAKVTLTALWHWGEPPMAQDAPVAVERLSQQAARYDTLCGEIAAMKRSVAEQRARVAALQAAREDLLAPFGQAAAQEAAAVWLREASAKASAFAQNIKTLQAQIAEFVAQNGQDVQPLPEAVLSSAQEEDLNVRKQALEAQAQSLQRQIALTRQTLQQQSEAASAIDTLQDEIAACRQGLDEARLALSVVQETQKYMKQAKDTLSGRYLQRMKDSFSAYYTYLTGETDTAFTMDGGFVVKLRRGGASRAKDAFSAGQRDVISLCARLALVDALFEEETPFLVLDDPFANMDDETAKRAKELLQKAAQAYQILYLTCHSSRA